jgi:hypothetical protein
MISYAGHFWRIYRDEPQDKGSLKEGIVQSTSEKMCKPEFSDVEGLRTIVTADHRCRIRYTPVNLGLLVNAQSLIDMSKLRLCTGQAHRETVAVFEKIKQAISEVDPDLACMMVRKCVYRGGICGEPRCCGFNHSPKFQQEMTEYLRYFSDKQIGCYIKD